VKRARKPAAAKKKPTVRKVTKRPVTPRVKKTPAPKPPAEPSAADRKVAVAVFVPKPRTKREIVEAICDHVIEGDRVHLACSKEGITWKTLFYWKEADAELGTLYARARKASAESFEDKASKHAEEATVEAVQVDRLKVDTAKWRAKMADPLRFGEKIDVTSAGERLGLEELVVGSMQRTPDR
jgi:hypothetical protein